MIEGFKQQIVLGRPVVALGFELGDRDSLDQFGQLGQSIAVGLGRGRAVVEGEGEDAVRGVVLDRIGLGEKALRLEHAQAVHQPRPPVGGQLVARHAFADDTRQQVEVECVLVRPAERGPQALRLAPGL